MNTSELATIVALAKEQLAAEDRVAEIERALASAKQRLSRVRDQQLPTAMTTAGLLDFTLEDGTKIAVADHYRCGQLDDAPDKEDGRPLSERLEALSWLEGHGHGDLPKRVVTVTLGGNSEKTARELIDLIRQHPKANSFMFKHHRTVVWNTLAKFAKEMLTSGEDVPLDVLGVSVQRSAKITRKD